MAPYVDDPVAFVHDILGVDSMAPYQAEILSTLASHRRVAVRGPHGLGKTATAAWATLWFLATRPECKIPTTASAWRQLSDFLWPEIHRWALRANWARIGLEVRRDRELLKLRLVLSPARFAFALVSSDEAKIEGAHSAALLYVLDEAKAIPDPIWDAIEGAFSTGDCYALAISTPGPPAGRFYRIHTRQPGLENWVARHITVEEAVAAGRVSAAWVESCRRLWGAESPIYQTRVLGEFAESDGLIPLSWVEAAVDRWRTLSPDARRSSKPLVLGVDVARQGSDRTCLALRYGDVIAELRYYDQRDTMEVAGLTAQALDAEPADAPPPVAVVDVVGIGAGVVDRLVEQGHAVVPFSAGSRTDRTDRSGQLRFADTRSAAWWGLRERLDPANSPTLALPPDDQLIADLTAPSWSPTSGGTLKVESKDSIRSRLGRSPDAGDAVAMAFYLTDPSPRAVPHPNLAGRSRWRSATPPSVRRSGSRRIR
ncbi:MAG TPA: hypothetical protein EYP14_20060 [Planctomycetaceae bacterium]|nr:hypothetical protein [Planctomycetaceae bacterium]